MTDAPDPQKIIRAAKDAINRVLSAQRFEVVVERVRKQVKVKGEKRSKWVDTDRFTFKLFEGATITLGNGDAIKLTKDLNGVIQRAVAPWRKTLRERISKLAHGNMTLSSAKAMHDGLHMIGVIDGTYYVCMANGSETSNVAVCGVEPIVFVGTDREMETMAFEVNRGLASFMQPYQEQTNYDLQKAMDAVP